MAFPVYATNQDVLAFLGVQSISDPNFTFLVNRANDTVHMAIVQSYDSTNSSHVFAAKMAVCAQAAFWLTNGSSPLADSSVSSYSLGDLSVTKGSSPAGSSISSLCPLAKEYLRHECLLYKGYIK